MQDPNTVLAVPQAGEGSGGDSGTGAGSSTMGGVPETVTTTAEIHSPMRPPLGLTPTRLVDLDARSQDEEEQRVK